MAERLAELFGSATCGVIHYGSRAQCRAWSEDSPYDFIIVLDSYSRAYRSFALVSCRTTPPSGGVRVRQRPRLARILAKFLAPNSLAARIPVNGRMLYAKCLIISVADLERECGPAARDHFMRARLMQLVQTAWSRDATAAAALDGQIESARRSTFQWARTYLPDEFDLITYCRLLLDVSLRAELRLEPISQAAVWLASQRGFLEQTYGPILDDLARAGSLGKSAARYRLLEPPTLSERLRTRIWFQWSRVRTTVRLLKHPFLYEGWVGHLRRKRARLRQQYA